MGNVFGDFKSFDAAQDALIERGFDRKGAAKHYMKKSYAEGAPKVCFVEISKYRVDGKYAPDGKDYFVFQHRYF